MKFLVSLPLIAALVTAAPYDAHEDISSEKIIITKDFYDDDYVIYQGTYDIVDIMVPLNAADTTESSDTESFSKKKMVFFVEADTDGDNCAYHGIYKYKDGMTTKIMDKGRAVAASTDDSPYVFFGGEDGLYIYDPETESAIKYGKFNYPVKAMAVENDNDAIYILTDDRELYKVFNDGTELEKIEEIKGANQILMDYSNNLYYYGDDKKPYVRTADGEIERIVGTPEDASEVRLFRPKKYNHYGAEFLVDNEFYFMYPSGVAQTDDFSFTPDAKPTAYSFEHDYCYIAYNKKIYEYYCTEDDSSESDSNSKSDSESDSDSKSDSESDSDSKSDSEFY